MVKMLRPKSVRSVRIPALALIPRRAEEIMTHNPISIPEASTVRRAADFLLKHHFSAAPVIDTAGRAVGVVSVTDLLRKRERCASPEYYANATLQYNGSNADSLADEHPPETEVRHVMTPMVFSVTPKSPMKKVIDAMVSQHVHRLFVADEDGALLGVISTFDILKHLKAV